MKIQYQLWNNEWKQGKLTKETVFKSNDIKFHINLADVPQKYGCLAGVGTYWLRGEGEISLHSKSNLLDGKFPFERLHERAHTSSR